MEKKEINQKIDLDKRLNTFCDRLKKLRIEKGKRENRILSQVEASLEMGFGYNTLHTYESGRFPKADKLIIIKNYYDVSYEYLLDDSEEENPSPNYKAEENKKAINQIKEIVKDL